MRVLLVDDEAAFARPLAERLELRGMEAGVALDAEAALAMLAEGEISSFWTWACRAWTA